MIEQRYGPLGVGDRATADDPRWGDMDDHAVVVRIPNHPLWLKDAALDGPRRAEHARGAR